MNHLNAAGQYIIGGINNGITSEINGLNAGFGHHNGGNYNFSN